MASTSSPVATVQTQVEVRGLTLQEINDMMKDLPDVQSAVHTAGKFTRRKLISRLRDSLKLFRIVPSQINNLKDEINRKFRQALMPIGQPVGMTAVEAIIQPIQQMALNSFHASGSAKNVSLGVGQISSVISASENPKVRSVSVHFSDRSLTLEQVLAKRKDFVGITVRDFISEILIDKPSVILNDKIPWWYHSFKRMRDLQEPNRTYEFPTAQSMMRMILDNNKMYIHEVTAQEICNKLQESAPVICIWSPLLRVNINGKYVVKQYIHVYPIESNIQLDILNIDTKSMSNLGYINNIFFELSLIPGMQSVYVKGIEGIENLYPVEQPVWSIVANETQIHSSQLPTDTKNYFTDITQVAMPSKINSISYRGNIYWYLRISNQRQRMSGIPVTRIAKLCAYLGMTVIDYSEEKDIKYKRSSLYGIDDKIIDRQSYVIVKMPELLPADITDATKQRVKYSPIINRTENNMNSYNEIKIITENVKPSELMQYYLKLDKEKESAYVIEQVREIIRLNNVAYQKKKQASDETLSEDQRESLMIEATNALTQSRSKVPARPTKNSLTHQMMTYVYADTIGTNLRAILLRDDVDTSHTYSSNMFEILEAFGIEAVRSFLIKTINDAVKFEGYINPSSIILLADFMTHTGALTKITFKGLKEQSTSFISQASLEQAMPVYAGAAAFGRTENIKATSASIAVGKRISVGTGAGRNIDPDLRRLIEADLRAIDTGTNTAQIEASAFTNAFSNINTSPSIENVIHYDERGYIYDGTVHNNVMETSISRANPLAKTSAEFISTGVSIAPPMAPPMGPLISTGVSIAPPMAPPMGPPISTGVSIAPPMAPPMGPPMGPPISTGYALGTPMGPPISTGYSLGTSMGPPRIGRKLTRLNNTGLGASDIIPLPFSKPRQQQNTITPGIPDAAQEQSAIPAPNAGVGLRAVASSLKKIPIYAGRQNIAEVVTVTSVSQENVTPFIRGRQITSTQKSTIVPRRDETNF